MFYYQFNIGDYLKHTAHLTPLEDIAYRRLLDTYYDTEKPIPNDIPLVSRKLRIDAETVEMVLKEFFLQTEEGYRNKRADIEIEVYHAFLNKQKANGIKGGRPKNKPTDNPPLSQAKPKITLTTNREPLNTNQEPITTGTSKTIVARSDCNRPETVSEQVWSDFQTLRRAKKAPLTNSALSRIDKEAGKAGISLEAALVECCARGWAGFKAEWMQGKVEPFDLGAATQRILQRELEKESTNPWESI